MKTLNAQLEGRRERGETLLDGQSARYAEASEQDSYNGLQ